MKQSNLISPNINTHGFTQLGYKIFLDRYAQKDMTRQSVAVGSIVIALIQDSNDDMAQQREIAIVREISDDMATVETITGEEISLPIGMLDVPIETDPNQMYKRIAEEIASVEFHSDNGNGAKVKHWQEQFYDILSNREFVPGGRIMAWAGTGQDLTAYNCVSGDTLIHTKDGLIPAQELEGKSVLTLSEDGLYREAQWANYGVQQLWKITMENGDIMFATKDHEWVVWTNGNLKRVTTENLENQRIPLQPVQSIEIDNQEDWREGIKHGYFYGDGVVNHKNHPEWNLAPSTSVPAFTDNNKAFVKRYYSDMTVTYQESRDAVVAHGLPAEYKTLPSLDSSKSYKAGFIAGLLAADGHVDKRGSVMIHQSNREELESIRVIAASIGLPAKSIKMTRENNPFNGEKSPNYKLQFDKNGFLNNPHMILLEHHIKNFEQSNSLKRKTLTVKVSSVEPTERYEKVYCCVEPETHTMVIGYGYLTGQCYVIPSPHDSREGIMKTLTEMTEIMSRGGGVGINVSSLRPRNAYVAGVNGRSSGSVSWGALYSFVTGLIEQGGSRRGALMIILNDHHPDLMEFINSKREAGKIENANISVGTSDKFMQAVKDDAYWSFEFPDTSHEAYDDEWDGDLQAWKEAGYPTVAWGKPSEGEWDEQTVVPEGYPVRARQVWNAIIESAWTSAEPGLWFRERTRRYSNSDYYDEGKIISTNPCVTGDTLIYTDGGLIKAEELFNEETEIEVAIDGRFQTESNTLPSSRVFYTGEKDVYTLKTKEGYSLRATSDHRIMTDDGWVELNSLEAGDKIHILNRKGGFGTEGNLELGRTIGWLVGDGHMSDGTATLSFYHDKMAIADQFAEYVTDIVEPLTSPEAARSSYPVGTVHTQAASRKTVSSTRLHNLFDTYGLADEKHQVPNAVFKGTEDMQRGFLQALFSADSSFQGNTTKGTSIRLSSSYVELLEDVQKLLLNFGIASKIYTNRRDAQYRGMPDGKGGTKEYWCRASHELMISRANIGTFADEVGFLLDDKQVAMMDNLSSRKRKLYREHHTATVESITYDGTESVYDLTEQETHSFIANGIVVHNCGEQGLPAYGVCNLGAIHLGNLYDDEAGGVNWKRLDEVASIGTRFLDNVIDATPYHMAENEDVQKGERRIGLGIMGLAELLVKCGVRYGSSEGVQLTERIFETIALSAYETSIALAEEKAPFPRFEADGFLSSEYMKAMPEYIRKDVKRHGIRNVTLLTVAPTGSTGTLMNTSTGIEPFFNWVFYRKGRLGFHEETVPVARQWLLDNGYEGDQLDKLPDYFVGAQELTPREHVDMQAAAQKWVDSAISKTVNAPNDYTVEQTRELYEYLYDSGCKGGTIYRDGSRHEQVLSNDADDTENSTDESVSVESTESPPDAISKERGGNANKNGTLRGYTVRGRSPFGKVYITINEDHEGMPEEVFIIIGKSGSDVSADAEAIGRLISLALQSQPNHRRMDTLKNVVDQMNGIGGSRISGFGENQVRSLPDAIAQIINNNYIKKLTKEQFMLSYITPSDIIENGIKSERVLTSINLKGANMCPECNNNTLLSVDGCKKCVACGYSEC